MTAMISACVLVATLGVALAAADPSDAQSYADDEVVEEYEAFSTEMAQTLGVSAAELQQLLIDEESFTNFAFAFQASAGVNDVDLWIGREDPAHPTFNIRVRNAALAEKLHAAIAGEHFGISIQVKVSEGWMLADRISVLDAATPDLLSLAPGVEGLHVDVASGAIVVSVYQPTGFPEDAVRALLDVPVRIDYADAPGGDTNRGGLDMSSCTTGFAATRSSGSVKGFLTAAHCNSSTWYPAGSSTGNSSTFYNQVHNANADIEGRTISSVYTLHRDVWQSGSTFTPYTGTATATAGSSVCAKGKTSGYKCGYVISSYFKPTYADACPGTTCNSVFLQLSFSSSLGDSGGPVIILLPGKYSALGITKGHQGSTSIASKIGYRPAGWSVY